MDEQSSLPKLRHNIFLIGDFDTQIYGNKLPSKLQVLKVLFFNLREIKLSLRDAAILVAKEVIIFWEKARLKTKTIYKSAYMIEALYEEWRKLQKNSGQSFNTLKEDKFTSELKNLLDISSGDILNQIDEEQREFLSNQRKPGRVGYIANFESIYDIQERKEAEREEIFMRRLKKSEMEKDLLSKIVELESSEESTPQNLSQKSIGVYSNISVEDLQYFVSNIDPNEAGPSTSKKARGTINIINEKVVAVMDQCQLSDRKAVHLITAIAQSLGHDVNSLIVNRTSINHYREHLRELKVSNIKKVFQDTQLNATVLHWDGKLLPNLVKREILDRLPIVITDGDAEKMLGIPELESGCGEHQANAIYEVLLDWGVCDSIKVLCCDTTGSNLGCWNGACVCLEKILKRELLWFPCRHHIFELILRCVFECKMPPTSGPRVPLFERFKESWLKLNHSEFKIGLDNEKVREALKDRAEAINSFAKETIERSQLREDYRELLELGQIFLGFVPARGIKLRYPGADHHARWMSKAIYSIKIYLFREQFKLSSRDEKALAEICIFILDVYLEAWFTVPLASRAPYHDLEFVKKLHGFSLIDPIVSQITLKKFSSHLWYLSPEAASLAFFDVTLSDDVKRRMVLELDMDLDDVNDSCPKRFQIKPKDILAICNKEMDYFITPQSSRFFERFGINKNFLALDPSHWSQDKSFQHGQFVLQLVTEYRKQFPDSRKSTVIKDFK